MRNLVTNKGLPTYGIFLARGKDASRLEQLSDCVFALAITMSLFSTEAPRNFDELLLFISDLLPFGLSALAVIWIWYGHYQFFMRFGLRDMRILILNSLMMLAVLFFVYPLKFLSTWLVKYFGLLTRGLLIDGRYFDNLRNMGREMIPWDSMPQLMIVYDTGFIIIFGLFILMHQHALKKRESLKLSETELLTTRSIIAHYQGIAGVSVVSLLIALAGYLAAWSFAGLFAGVIYFSIGPVLYVIGKRYQRDLQQLPGN